VAAMFTQQTIKDVWIVLAIGCGFLLYYLVYLRPRPEHWSFLEPVLDESEEGRADAAGVSAKAGAETLETT
jgi:hypothetical protein